MWYNAFLASALLLPTTTLALNIESHITTSTTLLCSTLYSSTSISGPLPTSTSPLFQTLELSPVVLHNYTSATVTITPKPFSTLFSVLATKTKTTEAEAVNGTFFVTETRFGTSTHWEHETTTKTATKTRVLTTRTTRWITAPTGFVGVREGIAEASSASASLKKQKRSAAAVHPHSKRKSPNSKKLKLLTPTSGLHAVEVICKNQVAIHTTEILLLTASKTATVTLHPETILKNRTVYGTVTSTILVSGSSSGSGFSSGSLSTSATAEATPSQAKDRDTLTTLPTPSPSTPALASMALAYLSPSSLPTSIATNKTTITKTPYTISFTWTSTITTTSTLTLHATTTLTSYSACATSNLLSQTFDNRLINGVSVSGLLLSLDSGSDSGDADAGKGESPKTNLQSLQTSTPSLCCETCIKKGNSCLWSIWQAEGKEKGSCYLFLLSVAAQTSQPSKNISAKQGQEGKQGQDGQADEAEQQCTSQNQANALFGYRAGNGEVRYVVSNGLCGTLSEA